MSTSLKIKTAEQLYDAGLALFQENRYTQALTELKKAEDAFRKIDVRGHPFSHHLPNGVTGLSNTLALSGLCYQRLADFQKAIICYETCLINSKFEKKRAFRIFFANLSVDLAACYEQKAKRLLPQECARILSSDPEIDTAFRFPFSLNDNAAVLARLYELAPDRYGHFKDFYQSAKAKDDEIRRRDKKSDESRMKKMGFFIWGALLAIWAIYGVVVAKAMLMQK
jgi:tetratricopeptide (TPR) repeat protein